MEAFSIENGVLRCPEDLNGVPPKELKCWCKKLLEEPNEEITIDLSSTRYMSSHHLGMLSEAWAGALSRGKELVIRVSKEIRRLFELSGFDRVFKIVESS